MFQQEMTGYELGKIAKLWQFDHFIEKASQASFYYYLKQLEEEGFIESKAVEGVNRPDKLKYKLILPKAKVELIDQVINIFRTPQNFYYDLNATMPFILNLEKLELLKLIEHQIESREAKLIHFDEDEEYIKSSKIFSKFTFSLLLVNHNRLHNQAEIKWLKDFYKMVENADYKKNQSKLSEIIKTLTLENYQNEKND